MVLAINGMKPGLGLGGLKGEKMENSKFDKNDRKENFTRKLGDKVERVGEKISEKGAPGAGKSVRDLGDRIEHSRDNK